MKSVLMFCAVVVSASILAADTSESSADQIGREVGAIARCVRGELQCSQMENWHHYVSENKEIKSEFYEAWVHIGPRAYCLIISQFSGHEYFRIVRYPRSRSGDLPEDVYRDDDVNGTMDHWEGKTRPPILGASKALLDDDEFFVQRDEFRRLVHVFYGMLTTPAKP